MTAILEIKDLKTSFFTPAGEIKAVNGVSLDVKKGEILGIVGESGSGKSVTMLSVLNLLGPSGKIVGGRILFNGEDMVARDDEFYADIRGNKIGMIFQDPMTSLNPVLSIGYQLREPLIRHRRMARDQAHKRAIELMRMVGIPDPEERIGSFPHEFSGGMRQRIMIAMAIALNPELIIADEPTTALDVTIQAQILDLMKSLKKTLNTSIILITHDLGIVADMADRIIIMYSGKVMEEGTAEDIFYNPKHPYTIGLLNSVPNPESITKKRLVPIEGQPPDLLNPPQGCVFWPRCGSAMKICTLREPEDAGFSKSHRAKCWLYKKPPANKG